MAAAEAQLGLDKVRLNKTALLAVLRENLKKHSAEYKLAQAGWRVATIEAMTAELQKANAGEEFSANLETFPPSDYSGAYEKIIDLLSASVDDIIVLSVGEFDSYYRDQWSWKKSHTMSVTNYSSKVMTPPTHR